MSVAHPDPDRLVLAALPAEPHDPEIAEHLAGCASCRAHIAALRHTVDLARTEHTEITTPPARVWQAIADELGEPAVQPEPEVGGPTEHGRPAEHGTVVRLDGQRPAPPRAAGPNRPARRRPRWRALGIPIAAAVAGIAAGIAIGYALAPATPPPDALLATLQPISAADPTATGTVDGLARNGTQQLVIRINGVTDTVGGDYLEAWLIDPLSLAFREVEIIALGVSVAVTAALLADGRSSRLKGTILVLLYVGVAAAFFLAGDRGA